MSRTRPLSEDELLNTFDRALGAREGQPGLPPQAVIHAHTSARHDGFDLPRLLNLDDHAFLEAAYSALLHRAPDEAGRRHYLAELGAGRSRMLILGELRYSVEGRRVDTPVPGLRARFLLHRLYAVPLFGRVLRVITAIAAVPGLMHDVRRLSNELGRFRAQVAEAQTIAEQGPRFAIEQADRNFGARIGELRSVLEERIQSLSARVDEEPWADPLLALAERFENQGERLDLLERRLQSFSGHVDIAERVWGVLNELRQQLGWPEAPAALGVAFGDLVQEQRNLATRAISSAERNQALLRDQERRLSLILREVRTLAQGGDRAAIGAALGQAQRHFLDELYVAFEDRFRGSRADIKGRQRVYLDLLRAAGAGTAQRPIVDVGSGRGELLELLKEEGLQATGVDLNEAMVDLCREAGLDAMVDDAVGYLNRAEPDSFGAVTGFHIIEHLPFSTFVGLLDASLRALASGGIIIFETPNPANLLVASRWFYLDPTHRNPLPGEMVAMIAEARGFVDVSIRELHPMQTRFEAQDHLLANQLDAIFYGPQDYALIARKA